ncbi:hypothetical protein [Helicobacter cappadocius]|uniref:Uncharacterized protein n=1 Tax=Helicobacter cappadocius TaxID=3063998 RepID=A0AA90PII9_9HELI|nr:MULTISPECIES: hypothetical protein [unclassified Helicobacter]MDO7252604.1 hypothetical protein [Helicobacter sp. faydin-H75]MDP2538471.1 hypothetical protein [Helicobacter sp. faydin-H76]
MNDYVFSLAYMAFLGYFGHRAKVSKKINFILMILGAIVVNIPINNLSINILTYSYTGRMSVFLFTFCIMTIFENLKTHQNNLISLRGFVFIFLFGLILYLSALNLIPINLYYQSSIFIIITCCLITIVAYYIDKILGIIYLLCLFAYSLNTMDSKNLFDYFIDVPTWILSIISIIIYFIKKISNNNYYNLK